MVKEGTELNLEQDCRVARGGYAGGGGRRRAVSGRVARTLWNADWVPRDLMQGCRIVRGGYREGGGRRRAGRAGLAYALERSLGSKRLGARLPRCARRLSVGWGPPPRACGRSHPRRMLVAAGVCF